MSRLQGLLYVYSTTLGIEGTVAREHDSAGAEKIQFIANDPFSITVFYINQLQFGMIVETGTRSGIDCIALNLANLLWSRRTFSFRSYGQNPFRPAQLFKAETLVSQTCWPTGGENYA